MRKTTQYLLILIGLLDIVTAVCVARYFAPGQEVLLTVIPGMLVFNFFMYKLLAGWLIANMTVTIEGERKPIAKVAGKDHLALKITLSKGSIDSIWLERIEIHVSKINIGGAKGARQHLSSLRPYNMTKRGDKDNKYWNGKRSPFYTISSGEQTQFSAYTTVPGDAVLAVELLVLGNRLFNGIETLRTKHIQWRSSIVILPR